MGLVLNDGRVGGLKQVGGAGPAPQDPGRHEHRLCKYAIYVYGVKDELGHGGGEDVILKLF